MSADDAITSEWVNFILLLLHILMLLVTLPKPSFFEHLNHPLLFQNGGLQLGDDGDEDIATGGGQGNFGIHSLYVT